MRPDMPLNLPKSGPSILVRAGTSLTLMDMNRSNDVRQRKAVSKKGGGVDDDVKKEDMISQETSTEAHATYPAPPGGLRG